MKLLTKLYLGIGLILLVFSIVTFSYLYQSAKLDHRMDKVQLSSEVLRQSEKMQKSLVDMETGFRGFLIGEDESFLQPYHKGHDEGNRIYKEIMPLLEDTAEIRLLEEIGRIEEDWRDNFSLVVIDAKRKVIKNPKYEADFELALDTLVKTGYGKMKMDLLRRKFEEFDRHHLENKNEQLKLFHQSLEYTRIISSILTVLAIITGIFIAYLLGKTVRKRLTAMINLADQIAKGNFKGHLTDNKKDEMSLLSRSLNTMVDKLNLYFTNLTKANKELDQFAYVVSHDLKAPLRAINNLAEWISEDITDKDPEIMKKLELMRGRVQRMENLINGILAYSKVGRKDIAPETFEVNTLLGNIIDMLAPPSNYQIILPTQPLTLTTQKIMLVQVLSNLIGNSFKYNNKPDGVTVITWREAGSFYEFMVKDNGPGIPEQFHDRIFGVFQTIEARDTRESTGIGLAIVKKIIEEKGGRIRIESKENEFTSFIFTWPR
ncbi:CHASE3 domain-containing protein [Adhaeribacter sp. BT258]|uniref:histidine kinase n=1 Tax=Adhaeribacter terrigena TaxID=2793070 RepID=A0ABS1C0W3_9BACT|nr:ATP-binding protein [Adhaeribacter terrigena]MBK0402974.1 CHASE3 domain-containing protein [Adhaeribacter terrigena]